MKRNLTFVLAGAAALAGGFKWIKSRRWGGSGNPVTAAKVTANRVKERIRPSADAESEPSADTATEASDDEAVEASDDEAVEASDDELVEASSSKS